MKSGSANEAGLKEGKLPKPRWTGLDDGPPDSIVWHKNRRAPTGITIRCTIQGKAIATFGEESLTFDSVTDLAAWIKYHAKGILYG